MLLLGGIIVVLSSKGHCAAVGNLAAPGVLVGHAVDIDLAGCIRKVKAAVLGVESADSSGKLVEIILVGRLDKLINGLGYCIAVVSST